MLDNLQFASFAEFLDMGGYAFNVWSVYLLFVIFFAINLYHPLLRKKQILKEQKRRLLLGRKSATPVSASSEQSNPTTTIGENL